MSRGRKESIRGAAPGKGHSQNAQLLQAGKVILVNAGNVVPIQFPVKKRTEILKHEKSEKGAGYVSTSTIPDTGCSVSYTVY